MTMMSNNEHYNITKQVYFANGFPPKGLVNNTLPKTGHQGYKLPGRRYVSLDEVSPQLGHSSRTIPPLAKGRGQFCSVKFNRPEDNRYKWRPDPFKCHKGAEKTGFSASPVKHAKPKMPIRTCHSSEPPTPPPPTAAVYNLKTLARRSVYSTPLIKSAENDFDEDMVKATVELKSKNNKIISDVEKETIQTELAGLEEVYHRICNGKMESLYSLLYPSRRDARRGPVQYIKTSAPLPLRSPRAAQRIMKTTKEKDSPAEAVEANGTEKKTIERRTPVQSSTLHDTVHEQKENTSRPILIPLPYVRPEIGVVAAAKQHKPAYNVPLVYTSRTAKTVLGHALNNTTPAVITFNPMDIPELVRPGAKNGPATGFVLGAQSKANTGTVGTVPDTITDHASTVSSRATPNEARSQSEKKSEGLEFSDPMQYAADSVAGGNDSKIPEIPINQEPAKAWNTALEESDSAGDIIPQEFVAQGIRLSITTEEGKIGGLEIFDYDKRDIEGEQLVAKHMEELEEIGEKKIKEFEELLEEHQHIIDEVKVLEKELENSHHNDKCF